MASPALYYSPDDVTVEEYLRLEETAETKHEYADGKIIAMGGTLPPHNLISGNVYTQMNIAFGDRPCRVYFADIRLRTRATRFRYPDVMALCGEQEWDDSKPPCLLNPQVIVEVLSASTERIDFVTKFEEYTRLPSVTDYIVIAQDRYWVVHHSRGSDGKWNWTLLTEREDILHIASIYRNVEISEEAPDSDDER